jgi:hypothetical protein
MPAFSSALRILANASSRASDRHWSLIVAGPTCPASPLWASHLQSDFNQMADRIRNVRNRTLFGAPFVDRFEHVCGDSDHLLDRIYLGTRQLILQK